MKKTFLLMITIIAFCLSLGVTVVGQAYDDDTQFLHPLYKEEITKDNIYAMYDYMFIAKVLEQQSTNYNDYEETGVPTTYFTVKVLEQYKGELRKVETIQFFGGYSPEGTLILLEDMTFLQKGETYLFFAAEPKQEETPYNRPGSFSVNHYLMVNHLKGYDDKLEIQYQDGEILDLIQSFTWLHDQHLLDDGIGFDPGDGGGTSPGNPNNTTWENAIVAYPGHIYNLEFTNGETRWFKLEVSEYDTYSLYSFWQSSGLNLEGEIRRMYDGYPGFGGRNADVAASHIGNGYGLTKTTSPNFYINFAIRTTEEYYIKITPITSVQSGTAKFRYEKDTPMFGNYSDLITSSHSVRSDKKIRYRNETKYWNYVIHSASMYNELNLVTLELQNGTINPRIDLRVRDFYNSTSGVFGTYNPITHVITLNTYWLDFALESGENGVNFVYNTILHEFGHALGLQHSQDGNIMHYRVTGQSTLGSTDIAVLRQRWG